jgi:hypothetical protein
MSAFFKILKNNTNIKIPFSSTPHPEPNIMELGTLHGDPWYPSNFHLPIQRLIDFDSSNFMAIADDIVQPNNQKLVKISGEPGTGGTAETDPRKAIGPASVRGGLARTSTGLQ